MELSTTLAVTGLFVQVLFDKSLTILGHGFQYWFAADPNLLPEAVDKLKFAMANVLALLPRVKSYLGENEGILILLKSLKDAAYEADDLLSELEYYRLQQQVEGDTEINNRSIGGFLSHMLNIGDHNKDDMVSRINKVVDRLDSNTEAISKRLPLHTQEVDPRQLSVTPSHRVTTSRLTPKLRVFGRDKQRDDIIELLLSNQIATTSVAEPLPDVALLPIVGMGGIGKTTLARMVYKDKRVTGNFDCMLWLCVSHDFDVVRLTREMLQCLGVHGQSEITNVDLLQQRLTERLCSRKYLLVLDDVWNEAESYKWRTFCAPLVDGKPGSRILMTTRLHTVVRIASNNMDILGGTIELKGLPEDDYLSLFYKYAFGGKEPHDPALEEIGKLIAVKLKGNPLAAETVGGMLQDNLDSAHWRSILSSNVWKLEKSPDDIMPVLRLSYEHLPPHLQQCFSYCSVFPKDWHFKKDELVRMWISHGYVIPKSNERLEDVGSKYFDSLLSRSFFQAEAGGYYFVIHDLLHDVAESVSGDECFRLHGSEPTKVPGVVRHLFVGSADLSILQGCSLRDLRTLIIFSSFERCDCTVFEGVLKELRSVRVLFFIFYELERLPVNVEHLIHLRHNVIHCMAGAPTIPESWCMLYHLQYLRIDFSSRPPLTRITNLINLMYWNGLSLECAAGIGKMTSLQYLDRFKIGKDEGRKLAELKNLNELRGSLSLKELQNVTTRNEALEAELDKKVHIHKLTLHWRNCRSPKVADEVLQGLKPPPYIQKLKISGYCGMKSPAWMMPPYQCLSDLQSLELKNCINWKDLPPIGELPLLKKLWVHGCPLLQSLPRLPATLEELYLEDLDQFIGFTTHPEENLSYLTSLHELVVVKCPLLQSLPRLPAMLEQLVLRKLDLFTCFTRDPEENLSYLTSLHLLQVHDCPLLQFLPLLPATLKILYVERCAQLPFKGGYNWHNISHVPKITWH